MLPYFIHISLIAVLVFLIYRNYKGQGLASLLLPALGFKMACGISLGLLYLYYYPGGDTWNYHKDAALLADYGRVEPLGYIKGLLLNHYPESVVLRLRFLHEPRALLFSKAVSLLYVITSNNYWISALYLSLFSFSGMWFLANRLCQFFPNTKAAAAIGFLFFPSVIFWSSGIMKESLVMGMLGYAIGFCLPFLFKRERIPAKERLLLVIFLFFIWQFKYYYAAIMIPLLASGFIFKSVFKNREKGYSLKKVIMLYSLIFICLLSLTTLVHPNLNVNYFLEVLVLNNELSLQASAIENVIHFDQLQPNVVSILANFPLAIFSGIFRPLVFEANTFFQWCVALENLFLLLFGFGVILKMKSIKCGPNCLWVYAILIYIILLGALLAFASPNFGSLVRYKIGFIPFLVYLIMVPYKFWFRKDSQ